MWQRYKPAVTRLVMWSIKNHWLVLVFLIGAQYLTGEAMVEPKPFIPFGYSTLFSLHSLLGKIILLTMVALAVEKLYLWLLRKQKI